MRPRGDEQRRLRWDRIAIVIIVVILAVVFWWGLASLLMHRLVQAYH
jgi:preprotein translocase subunit SecE